MIKSRKQLRGVTALLGLEYCGKAAFIFLLAFNGRPCYNFEQRFSGCLLLESSDSTWVSPEALFFAAKNTPGLFMESPGVSAFT